MLVCSPHLHAQRNNARFERITIEHGLSQSTVRCILQDRQGFMWFGTEDGLNKYDGYTFKVYKPEPDDPNSISSNFNRSIYEDRAGTLWIGTNGGGLNRFDRSSERFVRYQHDPDDPASISSDFVYTVYEDRAGRFWVTTDGGGLNRFDRQTETFTRYRHDPEDPLSISDDAVLTIYEDGDGTLWVGTRRGGLNRFDAESGRFVHYLHDPADSTSLSSNFIRTIYEDQEGTLWIGTDGGGLNRFDRENEIFTCYRNDPQQPGSICDDRVWVIYEDGTGTLWIGTDGGGLNRFDRENEIFTCYRHDPNDPFSIGNNSVFSIYEDRLGVLWFGTEISGVNKMDREREKFCHYQHVAGNPNSLSSNHVWSIFEDCTGTLWIGTRTGGLNKYDPQRMRFTHYTHDPDDPNSLPHNHVRAIYEAPSQPGIIWIGTDGGGLSGLDPAHEQFTHYQHDHADPKSISGNRVYSILEDQTGTLWIGTRTGGLNRFDREQNTFTHYVNDPDDLGSLSNNFVYKVYEDRTGVLWIGTFAGGLSRFDREAGRFAHYRSDTDDPNSISSDCVLSIHEDRTGVLWIGTGGGGLNRFDRKRGIFTAYREEEGLPNEVVYGILEDDRGDLWLSTNSGLARFDPRTETCKNFTAQDGLQSNEFNGGSYFRSPRGELFFGGINGLNAFYPAELRDNPHVPPVVITSFSKLNREVDLGKPISEVDKIKLSQKDYVFSFEFAALDYTAPEKNRYAYKMEGLDDTWIYTDASKRFAKYTTLPPGTYTFRVKGSNNDGFWNEAGAAVKIVIMPVFWNSWWFRALLLLLATAVIYTWHKVRVRNVRLNSELKAAHDAQMSIMPQGDPVLNGLEVSGVCLPANEVGGDFYDYLWLDEEKRKFGIAIGDVSGKAMNAAMVAVMSSGLIHSKAGEICCTRDIMTQLNRTMYLKTNERMFTSLCLASIDTEKKTLTFTNAGFNEPLLKSNGSVKCLQGAGHMYPLGIVKDAVYRESSIQLQPEDVLVLCSDGVTEARNGSRKFYEHDKLKELLEHSDTAHLSAQEIKDRIVEDVQRFTGSSQQADDMTIIVLKLNAL